MKPALSPQTTGFLPRSPQQRHHVGEDVGLGHDRADDLDEVLHGRRVEEVDAHHPAGARVGGGDLGDAERGRVGRQDGVRTDDAVQHPEDRLLDLERLDDGLDHEVGVGEVLHLGRQRDAAEQLVGRLLRHLLALDRPTRGVLEVLASALDGRVADLDPDDRVAVAREHLGDAGAHGAEADDADGGELASSRVSHGRMLPCRPRIEDVGSVTPPGVGSEAVGVRRAPRRPVGPGRDAPPWRTARAAGAACHRAR